jgi:outer membrane protein OmpA-like peptidoglycan-associated protein
VGPDEACRGTIYLEAGLTRPTAASRAALDRFADCLRGRDGGYVLTGHTDARGTAEYNFALGERQARAVRAELKERGVAEDRLATRSWGEEQPLCREPTAACRARNRRVEIAPAE